MIDDYQNSPGFHSILPGTDDELLRKFADVMPNGVYEHRVPNQLDAKTPCIVILQSGEICPVQDWAALQPLELHNGHARLMPNVIANNLHIENENYSAAIEHFNQIYDTNPFMPRNCNKVIAAYWVF